MEVNYKKAVQVTDSDFSYHLSDRQLINKFIASEHRYLKPLISMSEMDSYWFERVNDILLFDVDVVFESDSPDLGKVESYYRVRIELMNMTDINIMDVNIVFFA